MLKWPDRSPDDVLDYGYDWAPRLAQGETITSAQAEGPDSLEIFDESLAGAVQTLWIKGPGGQYAHIKLTAETNQGRVWTVKVRLDTV